MASASQTGGGDARSVAAGSASPVALIAEGVVECHWGQSVLEEANAAFAAMRADAEAWAQELAERGDWDAALGDGLDEEAAVP